MATAESMSRLLSLSDELLLEIISYLQPTPEILPASLYDHPFYRREYDIGTTDYKGITLARRLFPVLLVCRRLYGIAIGALYRHIPLFLHENLSQSFASTLSLHPHLAIHIRSVDLDLHCCAGTSQIDVRALFCLPNIHTISLHRWEQMEDWELQNQDYAHTSSVQALRLMKCALIEGPLAQVLSWPTALKELWYDYDPESYIEWPLNLFSCEQLERAIASQVDSLETLIFTANEADLSFEEEAPIDLRQFSRLKSLAIPRPLLLLSKHYSEIPWERLPRSLQVLEVRHGGDENIVRIVCTQTSGPTWLIGISENRAAFVPSLEKVRITTLGGECFQWTLDRDYLETHV